ncbi:MAG: hypothetical protein WAN23_15135, partial [Candidatus Acidiferrales bacterium]
AWYFVHNGRQSGHNQDFRRRAEPNRKLTYFRMRDLHRQFKRLIDLFEDFPAVAHKHTPCGRDLYFVLAALQKLGADGFFQLNDLLAEPRLSCMQALGGPSEIEFLRYSHKTTQMA